MIIISQDKKAIHNFNNILSIQIEVGIKWDLIVYDAINDKTGLGEYDTEKRAKEILQQIIDCYRGTEAFKVCSNRIGEEAGVIAIENGFVYEMPIK